MNYFGSSNILRLSFAVERWARAIYDYDATCEDELSFQEGQLIRITSTEHNGVDDGWWEGEVNGTFGTFPSLVVEELLPVPVHNMQVIDTVHRRYQTSAKEAARFQRLFPNPSWLMSGIASGQPKTCFNIPLELPDGD